jgi:hypothetical protein
MKPRSAVAALLAVAETLLAARAKTARPNQSSTGHVPRSARVAKGLESRPLILRIKAQATS